MSYCSGEMAQGSNTDHALPVKKKKKKKQHSQETTQLSKSRPAPYLSPVSPYRLEQLILSPLFLLPLAWKKGPEQPNTIIIKKLIIKEKKTHLKGAISY